MAILAECPMCHNKQSTRNKVCSGKNGCGLDLDKAKRSKKVKYWIQYRLPGGKQRKEYVGTSIEEARDADGKRRVQKRENRIFEMLPEANMTFDELAEWYLKLERVKAFSSYQRYRDCLSNFSQEFGSIIVSDIRKSQIEDYQQKRLKAGKAPATVDREVGDVKTMVNAAYDDGLVGAQVVMTFKRVKNVLKRNANARKITLSLDNFLRLLSYAPPHLAGILGTGFYTGMRKSEILGLTWNKVDLDNRLIYLEAEDTKDDEPRVIPICDELYEILRIQPKSDNHNHVFSYRGKRIKDNFKRSFQTACRRAGIPYGRKTKGGITFHDLRHTFNTHMRKAGVPESVIMQITGHSTREMFDRYNTVDEDDAREAVEMFSGYLNRKDVANVTQTVTQEAKKASLH